MSVCEVRPEYFSMFLKAIVEGDYARLNEHARHKLATASWDKLGDMFMRMNLDTAASCLGCAILAKREVVL